jgi:hypothetical protein
MVRERVHERFVETTSAASAVPPGALPPPAGDNDARVV